MHIRFEKQTALLLLVIFSVFLCLGGGAYYYFFIAPRYGIYHEDLLAPDTALRVVFKPVLVQKYISSLAPAGSSLIPGIPKVSSMQQMHFRTEWIHKMPFEFSFLLDQRASDQLGVLFFVKEHPASESFSELVDDGGFFRATRPIVWDQSRMSRYAVRTLTATGSVLIPRTYQEETAKHHPVYSPLTPPEVKGHHFLEAALNNKNGTLIELLGAFSAPLRPILSTDTEKTLISLSPNIEGAFLKAFLSEADLLLIEVTVECSDSSSAEEVSKAVLAAAYDTAAFAKREGFALYWDSDIEDNHVLLTGEFSDFEPKIRRAMGG